MTDPSLDDERVVRAALGTLLVDEPTPTWSVADDVERGRRRQGLRRARLGVGVGLAAVAAVAAAVVVPMTGHEPHLTPAPISSESRPSELIPMREIGAYVGDRGWTVVGTSAASAPDGSMVGVALTLRATSGEPRTSTLVIHRFASPPPRNSYVSGGGFRPPWMREGGLLAACGTACTVHYEIDAGICFHLEACPADYSSVVQPVVTSRLQGGSVIFVRTWPTDAEVDAMSTPPLAIGSPAPVPTMSPAPYREVVPASGAFTLSQLRDIVDLLGEPGPAPTPSPVPSRS